MAKPHCLVVSYPLQGHVIPTVHLALKLAERGLTVTFVNTEAIDRRISEARPESSNDIFAGAREAGLDVRYELLSDGLPVEFDRCLNHDQFMASLLHVFSAHVQNLLSRMNRGGPPVTCLIADTFFVWPATLAKKYGLLYVSFWTEPAVVFALYYHLDLLRLNGHFGAIENREEPINYIPGVASMEPRDLMSYLQDTDISSVNHQIIFKAFDEARSADYVLCNTVHELEPEVISALAAEKPFHAIGPVSRLPGRRSLNPSDNPATSLRSESDCSRWLAAKPPGTVLYVSFGTYAPLSYSDLQEIAMGITTSNIHFLWALRPDIIQGNTTLDPLPPEFYEYIKDGKGLVVEWCEQNSVLSHPAVAGFLTHCGWNSVMESIWCGVPMLCLPLLTDQFTNRKLVVDDWEVGVSVGRPGGVRREAVAEAVEKVMKGVEGEEMRRRMEKRRRVLHEAVSEGGSSAKSLERFVNDLKNHVDKQHNSSN